MNSVFNFGLKKSGNDSDSTKSGDAKSKLNRSEEMPKKQSLKGSFESLNSNDLGFSQSKACYICSKTFTFRKKHSCKFCLNAVCSDHSAKVRIKEGMDEAQRICDFCDQDEEKTLIKNQIDDEVSKLGDELKQAKETNEKLYKEHFEKTTLVNNLEEDLNLKISTHKEKINQLNQEFESQKQLKNAALEKLKHLKQVLEDSKKNQLKARENMQVYMKNTEDFQQQFIQYHIEHKESITELKKIQNFIKHSLDTESFQNSLCIRCNNKITESLNKAKTSPHWKSIPEEEKSH